MQVEVSKEMLDMIKEKYPLEHHPLIKHLVDLVTKDDKQKDLAFPS